MAALVAVTVAAGCTPSTGHSTPASTVYSTIVTTRTAGAAAAPTPVTAGPTTATKASGCPFIARNTASALSGMRLDAVRTLVSGGRTVGCRFYPVAGPTADCPESCFKGEHLPPASQVAVEITIATYRTPSDAATALTVLRSTGRDAQPAETGPGLCYRNTLYAKDHGQDWSCAFSKRARLVVVATVTDASYSAAKLTQAVSAAV